MILPSALSLARDNVIFSLEECLTALAKGQDRDAYLVAQVADRYHVLGIAVLLQDADPQGFAWLLALSGQADCYLRGLDLSDHPAERIASRSRPFFDALAAGGIDSARTIAALAPDHHLDGWEYEDDFLSVHIRHRLLLNQDGDGKLLRVLDRWESILEGAPSPDLEAARALVACDATMLESALEGLMQQRVEKIATWRKSTAYNAELDATEGQVSVMGLAQLRLAELRGMAVRGEYPFMPALGRVAAGTAVPPPDSWRRIDAVRRFS